MAIDDDVRPIAPLAERLTRIRYTSMSPACIGNGWFGGHAAAAGDGDRYCRQHLCRLWYPISVAAMTLAIGLAFLRETKDVRIDRND